MSEKLTKYTVGDVVQLKSGSPAMVVNKINNTLMNYECRWFDENKKAFKVLKLSEEVLEKCDSEQFDPQQK